jgi:DNA invertase Pin-like site-specific DNA recombinase
MSLPIPDEWLLYLRKSQGYAGLSRQRTSTTDHLASRGGRVIEGGEFSDADRTAFRHDRDDLDAPLPPRPDFDRMLDAMAARPGVGIASWHADRLGRDPEAAEILIRACRRGGHLISTTRGGDYDVTTANGRDHLRTDIQRATHEVDHNVERLVEAKMEYAAEGRWLGGQRPFGWRRVAEGVLELYEAEAELIRRGSADVLAGVAVRAIARAWNDAGSTGSGGGRWTTATVHKVLSRPRNAGLMEHHGQVLDLGLDADGNPKRARWPAIIDEGTWRSMAAILSDPGRRSNHGGTAVTHLLTGIALCGGCGLTVVANKSAEGTPRYRCSRHARGLPTRPGPHASRKVADIDAYIAYLAVGRLKQGDAAELLREDRSEERSALLAKRAAAEPRKRRQWDLWKAEVITDLELADGRREIREELAAIDGQLAAIEQADALAPFLGNPEGAWKTSGLDRKRAAVAALMHITLIPGAKFSRPPGWKPGDGQFDPRLVDVRWAKRLPSDG